MGDLLTAYKGNNITYDEIGNPLVYQNGSSYVFTWTEGRRLATAMTGDSYMTFTYDDNGVRTGKIVDAYHYTYKEEIKMGWEMEIPTGMLFKKMYCSKCGEALKKQKITKIYKKGEEGFQNHILGKPQIGMKQITKCHYVYVCPNCNNMTTYDQQSAIRKKQRQCHKKIID